MLHRQASEPTLLLVDDKPANLVALEAVLEPIGAPIVKASSGEQALRQLLTRDDRFAVILLDVQMPGLDGFQTAELIRGRASLRHVPIIFITAISREEANIVKGYAHGAVDYLVKPFDPDALRAKVKLFVELHQRHLTLAQEKQAAEDQTIASEQRLRLALDAAQLGTWGWEAHDGAVFLDERCRTLLGLGAAAPEAGCPFAFEHLTTSADDRFNLEYRTSADRWLHLQGRAYRDAGERVTRVLGTVEDISQRKRARAERELFLGVLGHDLRNPLNAVTLAGHLLAKRPEPEVARVAQRVVNGARRMERLISDLLDFVSSRAGALPVTPQHTDLDHVCRDVIAEVEAAYPDAHISFDGVDDARGFWDPARLGQVVQNLVTNAVRHGDRQRPIVVCVRRQGDHVLLQVENGGPPIAPALRERIFEPFVTSASGGLGLGLYVANQLVLAHHGKIDCSSDAEKTAFRVVLPRGIPAPTLAASG
jgi:signal transduction histidine kinase